MKERFLVIIAILYVVAALFVYVKVTSKVDVEGIVKEYEAYKKGYTECVKYDGKEYCRPI